MIKFKEKNILICTEHLEVCLLEVSKETERKTRPCTSVHEKRLSFTQPPVTHTYTHIPPPSCGGIPSALHLGHLPDAGHPQRAERCLRLKPQPKLNQGPWSGQAAWRHLIAAFGRCWAGRRRCLAHVAGKPECISVNAGPCGGREGGLPVRHSA